MAAINRAANADNEPSLDMGHGAICTRDMTMNFAQQFRADGSDSHRETPPPKLHSSRPGIFCCILIKAFNAEAN